MISCECTLIDEEYSKRGVLELSGNKLIFSVSKGFLRKKKVIVREISLSDIIDVKYSNARLIISWMGAYTFREVFVAEKEKQEKLNKLANLLEETLRKLKEEEAKIKERRKKELERKVKEKLEKTIKIYLKAEETINALFGILRCLASRAEWNRAEDYLKKFLDNAKSLQKLTPDLNMDLTKISLAVRGHYRQETLDEAYGILSDLYNYLFGKKISEQNKELENIHPNPEDLKDVILANYMLNDIVLGAIVEDSNIQKEIDHFLGLLEKINNNKVMEIEVSKIKEAMNRLFTEGEKEDVLEYLKKALTIRSVNVYLSNRAVGH